SNRRRSCTTSTRPRRRRPPRRAARATTARPTTARATTARTTRAQATEMRSHTLRLYVFSITLLLFFVLWAMIAARPWAAAHSGTSPALKALKARERHLRHEARV